jgi:hypothetical protein
MKTYLKKIFFKWGIFTFNANGYKYGGFNHFIAGRIFRWKLCYLTIAIRKQWKFNWIHENEDNFYEGYHNCINIGFLQISYGT